MPKRDVRPAEMANLTELQREQVRRGLSLWMAANREKRRPALERRKHEQVEQERAAKARGRALQGR